MKNEETKSGANPEEFEQRLQRQPLRKIPDEWRNEMLLAARASCSQSSTLDAQPTSWWRDLLWPCPQAWAGLAAVWFVVLVLNVATRDPVPVREARKATPGTRNLMLALKEQEQLLMELTGPPPVRQVEEPKLFIPQPRSQRREDCFRT